MRNRIALIVLALALCLGLGLVGCEEQVSDEDLDSTPVSDMAVVSGGSLSAVVLAKDDEGIVLEVSNNENLNTVSVTFTSAKIGGKDYPINSTTFNDSPLSIIRVGSDGKTMNLSLPSKDFARIRISSSEFSSADDYNNVDLIYSETYMGDNGTITKTGQLISVKNA